MADTENDARPCWFVGASYHGNDDQTDRFVSEGIWNHALEEEHANYQQVTDFVQSMQPGDLIAIKSTYTRTHGLGFNNYGHSVSVMAIKAVGNITENAGDGRLVTVSWIEKHDSPREWYFYTNRIAVWRVQPGSWKADGLIGFAFGGSEQNIEKFCNDPYWEERFGFESDDSDHMGQIVENVIQEMYPLVPYLELDIAKDGSFLPLGEIERLLERLRTKKNLILQGPPGTGKTWLAKRLAYALMGEKNPHNVRAVQFHPNLSYEDFVRGWRPSDDGKLTLTDGAFMQAVKTAREIHPGPLVVVIEEINRGNPAQIFGELLTLLEADKRNPDDALELSYPDQDGKNDPVYIPDNLYVIGTMNLADRSLALVDFALRRRFAFVTLKPQFGDEWQRWIVEHRGIDGAFANTMKVRMESLNQEISGDAKLGPQFCIGHSYLTPAESVGVDETRAWFRQVVETEIFPLLEEYWFDDPDKAQQERDKLLEGS